MRHFILSLAAILATTSPVLAQDVARMDVIARTSAAQGFMGAVLVAKDGKVLFDKGFGSANLEWQIPNDGDTKFRLASVTKQFTATAILLLQERGKLRLDAPVKTYLPDAPAAWDKVTVFNLLTHSAGIPNFTSFDGFDKTKTLPTTVSDLIARFRDKPLDFAPGEQFKYSNSGYTVLTAIIEKVSGQSYPDFIVENLFKPLGMNASGYDTHAAILAHRASGYSSGRDGLVNAEYVDMSIPQGAGGLYSTTHDLLKWHAGLWGGKLLKPESLAAMRTPFKGNYAFGNIVVTRDGATTIGHGGGIEGFDTWLGYDPDRKISVVVLANIDGDTSSKIGRSMMTLARGGTITLPSERKAVPVPAATLKTYEGTYAITPSFGFVIRAGDDRLIAQATGQAALDLIAEGQDRFFFRKVDAQIDFTRDATGKIIGAVLHQNGRDQKAVRQ
jgi:CubicO group peptidase (beta-lactamase class C family)